MSEDLDDLQLYTRAEVAALLKVKESWLRHNQTWLPCTRVSQRLVRYSRSDIEKILRVIQQ